MDGVKVGAAVGLGDKGLPPLCVRCGYDLRGLPASGRCPECAVPVAWSAGDAMLLRFSGPDLIRKLRTGAALAGWAVALEVASVPIALLVVVTRRSTGWDGLGVVLLVLGGLLLTGVVGALLRLIGWWLLTARDHRWAAQSRDLLSRRIARWALVVDLAVVPPGVVFLLLGGVESGPIGEMFVMLLMAVHVAAWAVQFFASMAYLRRLAERIPSETVARRAGTARWLVPVLGLGLGWAWGIGVALAAVVYCHVLWVVGRELRAVR